MNRLVLALGVAILCAAIPLSAKNSTVAVKAETISGTLTIVSAEDNVIFVKTDAGITYDFRIEPATKITTSEGKIAFETLSSQIGRSVEVVFRPLKKAGNIAVTVDIK